MRPYGRIVTKTGKSEIEYRIEVQEARAVANTFARLASILRKNINDEYMPLNSIFNLEFNNKEMHLPHYDTADATIIIMSVYQLAKWQCEMYERFGHLTVMLKELNEHVIEYEIRTGKDYARNKPYLAWKNKYYKDKGYFCERDTAE